jgi:four helix bundle protein
MEKENVILELSFQFALDIISYCDLLEERRKYVIARQLLKSGTSIGANIREAQSAESKADFIHKMKIAAKEADETEYWLLLCNKAENYADPSILLGQIKSIEKILTRIITTSKSTLK